MLPIPIGKWCPNSGKCVITCTYTILYCFMYVSCMFHVSRLCRLSKVFGGRYDTNMIEVRTAGGQAGFQLALLISTLAFAIGGGLLAG